MLVLYFITYQKKNNFMKKILFSALLISYSFIQAQVDRSIMPKPTEAKKINISESQVFTTVNGITVILSENHK